MQSLIESAKAYVLPLLNNEFTNTEGVALFGAACVILIAGYIALRILRFVAYLFSQIRGFFITRKASRIEIAGYKILMGQLGGKVGWRKKLNNALIGELGEFLFSSNFVVLDIPPLPKNDVEVARRRLIKSNADIVVWGVISPDDKKVISLRCLRRSGGGDTLKTHLIDVNIPATKAFWQQEAAWTLVTYVIANGIQPILATPAAFRREKVEGLVSKLHEIIDSGVLSMVESHLQQKLEDEFCAGALHIAEHSEQKDYTTTVIEMRRAFVDNKEAHTTDSLIRAKMELGNALLKRSENKFDNAEIAESMTHLGDAIALMRRHPRIMMAQTAHDQLARAKGLIESRRRFSLSFG